MKYTVKQLANLAGISVRSLHYYDEIGLLKPSFVKENGYRYYEKTELIKLQQILFFRELEFSLEKIKQIMQSPGFNALDALKDQRHLLELKKQRINRLLKTIDETMNELKGGDDVNSDQKFSAFNDPSYQKYKNEIEQKWGNTHAYKQSIERVGKMSKEQFKKIKEEAEDIANTTADLLNKGFSVQSVEVQKQMDRFYKHLSNFYDPSYEMFKGLGQMYVEDSRFTAYYEKRAKGLAVFMRDAMAYYASEHGR